MAVVFNSQQQSKWAYFQSGNNYNNKDLRTDESTSSWGKEGKEGEWRMEAYQLPPCLRWRSSPSLRAQRQLQLLLLLLKLLLQDKPVSALFKIKTIKLCYVGRVCSIITCCCNKRPFLSKTFLLCHRFRQVESLFMFETCFTQREAHNSVIFITCVKEWLIVHLVCLLGTAQQSSLKQENKTLKWVLLLGEKQLFSLQKKRKSHF